MANAMAFSNEQAEQLLQTLKERFEQHMERHAGIAWQDVLARLQADPQKLWTLNEMERTGGEPDVIGIDEKTNEYLFCDCAAQTPMGRRNLCYDRDALDRRKEHKPQNSAMDVAREMGIEMLTEEMYRQLQKLGDFDTKSSSWIVTPPDIRKFGGALFGDKRYGRVFIYHNGAESYYSSRAFRGLARV